MIYILMISLLILVFRFLQLTAAVKLVPLKPHDRKWLSVETANAIISQPLTANKHSCQPLVVLQNLFPVANYKTHAWPHKRNY